MNFRRVVALIVVAGLPVALLAGILHNGRAPGLTKSSAPKTLYLHWCEPALKPARARMILTTPVSPCKKISITLNAGLRSLEGTIELKDGKYQADLAGHYCTTTGFFNGTIELNKPFTPEWYGFSSVLILMNFVLSTDPVGDKFLKESSWELPSNP
jgi:hypothetical protein